MNLLELMQKRRSVRSYSAQPVSDRQLEQLLQAGLLAPSSRNLRPWEFIVVRDKSLLLALSRAKHGAAAMLAQAAMAIVVLGDREKADTWIEDCAIAMTHMHLMAAQLGVGSCWIQCRLRTAEDGGSTEAAVRSLLSVPDRFGVLAILSLGIPQAEPIPNPLPDCSAGKVHADVFGGK